MLVSVVWTDPGLIQRLPNWRGVQPTVVLTKSHTRERGWEAWILQAYTVRSLVDRPASKSGSLCKLADKAFDFGDHPFLKHQLIPTPSVPLSETSIETYTYLPYHQLLAPATTTLILERVPLAKGSLKNSSVDVDTFWIRGGRVLGESGVGTKYHTVPRIN